MDDFPRATPRHPATARAPRAPAGDLRDPRRGRCSMSRAKPNRWRSPPLSTESKSTGASRPVLECARGVGMERKGIQHRGWFMGVIPFKHSSKNKNKREPHLAEGVKNEPEGDSRIKETIGGSWFKRNRIWLVLARVFGMNRKRIPE